MVLSEGSELLAQNLTNFWASPNNAIGRMARLVLDLGCFKKINGVYIRNTHSGHRVNRGTETETLWFSSNVLNASLAGGVTEFSRENLRASINH